MRHGICAFGAAILAVHGSMAEQRNPDDVGTSRRFTVRDSVQMSYFGNIRNSMADELDEDGITSPDGRWTIKVSHLGVLPEGVTEGPIWLFDARQLRASVNDPSLQVPKPEVLVSMSVAANSGLGLNVLDAGNSVIAPQWSADSHHVTFLGRNGRLNRQIFEIEISSRQLKELTPHSQDVIAFSRTGSTFAYLTGPDADLQESRAWVSAGNGIPDVTIGTGTPLLPLLFPYFRGNAYSEPLRVEVWKIEDGRSSPVIDSRTREVAQLMTTHDATLVSLSPGADQVASVGTSGDGAVRYLKIDLDSGTVAPLLPAPVTKYQFRSTGRYKAAWSPDGDSLAITEVALDGDERCGVAIVDSTTGREDCIAGWRDEAENLVYALRWSSSDRIEVRYKKFSGTAFSKTVFRRNATAWTAATAEPPDPAEPLLLVVREDLNQPPVLHALDPHTGRSRDVFDPNLQLAHIDLGSVRIYEWRIPGGEVIQGLLAVPPDFESGKRYPLVIQTHGFDESRFFRSGYSDTSNAGRALTGRGMMVLQVREPQWNADGSWRDAKKVGTNVYLAAIDQLSDDGLIDRSRVGISGYSYSGWLTAASITQAADRFAAAVIANSDPATLTGYYEYVDTPLAKAVVENNVGAQPYGDGLRLWFERSPSFRTHEIIAPVLIQAGDPWHLISLWDVYAALRDQGKPVELQYIRGGEHNIRKPLHVLAHQELIVDWFDFWLNGHEELHSSKEPQYVRWRAMREAASRAPSSKSQKTNH